MKKYALLFLLTLANAQVNLNQLSNSDLDLIKSQLNESNRTIANESTSVQSDNISEAKVLSEIKSQPNLEAKSEIQKQTYYGYNFFKRDLNFIDNIPAPKNYILGPGDKIIIYLWGETNITKSFLLDRNGSIFYEGIGFINLSNKPLSEAEELLKNKLVAIYSTLSESLNKTSLQIEIEKPQSINVFFTGQMNSPGVQIVHPFADIFTAIVQAGGVNKNGSLRKVQHIRDDKIINEIDFYNFFSSGQKVFSDIKLLNNDIINIPVIQNRVLLKGAIFNSGFFEFKNNETIKDILQYSNSLNYDYSSEALVRRTLPPDERDGNDNAELFFNIELLNFSSFRIKNGDVINFLTVPKFKNSVDIIGQVKFPGSYPYSQSLKSLLDLSGGFNDPTFRKSILDPVIVLRKDINQLYSKELEVNYDESDQFVLNPGDKVFVYKNIKFDYNFTYQVTGQVNKSGAFMYEGDISVADAILKAGGTTELGDLNSITLINDDGLVKDVTLDTYITVGSVLNIPVYNNTIKVDGNVYSPGVFTYDSKNSISKIIENSGGLKPNTNKKNIHVIKANGSSNRLNFLERRFTRLDSGDTLKIPIKDKEFNVNQFLNDFSNTLSNVLAIIFIIDRSNN